MAVIQDPQDPTIQMKVDPTYNAARMSLMPRDWSENAPHIGCHAKASYRTGLVTGVAAAGAIFSMRWANAQFNLLLQRLSITANLQTQFTTPQEMSVDVTRVINFSVADSGGTPITPLLKAPIKDTIMGLSQIADLRVAGVGALTNGTATVETSPIAEDAFVMSNVTGNSSKIDLIDIRPGEQIPCVFRNNEGFRIRILQAMGAAGVIVFHFNLDWVEIPNIY